MEWRSFDGYDQLEHWCWKQSITKSIFDLLHITKGALNSCSRHRKHHGNGEQNLNVGEGHTLCLTSQEQCCKFLQWQTLLLKDDQFESFPLVLSLSYRHLLELRRRFPHTQSQLSPHRILGASPILQCHICAVAGHLLGISVDRRCWKQSRGLRYLWNDSWFAC